MIEFEKLSLEGWAARRKEDLLGLLEQLSRQIGELDEAVATAAEQNPQARLLMTQPGVGPITALAFALTIGDVSRFQRSKQVSSYLGLIPRERSSGGKQRSAPFPNKAMASCGCYWSKRHRRPIDGMRDSAGSTRLDATTSQRLWPKWRRQENWQCDSTGCCAATRRIRRSLVSRVARGWEWSAQARPAV